MNHDSSSMTFPFSLHIKDYNTFALLSNKQIHAQTTDSRGYVSFHIKEFRVEPVDDKIQNFLARFCFYCIAIFLCLSAPLLADSNSFILNPIKIESFAKSQKCDITKKGNICEITFRIPLDLWRVWDKNNQHIDIGLYFYTETPDYWHNFSFDDKKLGFTTLPIQNASDFISRLYEVRNPNENYYHWTPEHLKAITHLLESYHSNQFF